MRVFGCGGGQSDHAYERHEGRPALETMFCWLAVLARRDAAGGLWRSLRRQCDKDGPERKYAACDSGAVDADCLGEP